LVINSLAASCGFDEFANSAPLNRQPYTLLQQEQKQRTKMLVVITMYNEDIDLFSLTLGAVYKNIEFLCSEDRKNKTPKIKRDQRNDMEHGKGQGEEPISWKDIVVCIVADGRQKCPPKVKVALEMLGCYQSNELIMQDFQEDPVQAHIFEHTSSVHLIPEPKQGTCRLEASKIPIQYLVCMKEFNKKKIDSHG
jgi:chitin synthase